MERTFVILKADAVQRGLIGEIIARFEKIGLKVVGMKMLVPDAVLANKHYPKERREFIEGMGQKTLDSYAEQGIDPVKEFGHADAHKIGLMVHEWLVDYLTAGPVIAMVLEAPHVIELVRKLSGFTHPYKAQPGTIRGDYSFDSGALANRSSRSIRNLIHASGNKEEAELEISLWFKPSETFDYDSVHQRHMVA